MRLFRILVTAFHLIFASALVQAEAPEAGLPELVADTSVIDLETGDFVATGNARATGEGVVITANEIRLNARTNTATARGNVVMTFQNIRFVGHEGSYDFRARSLRIGNFRAGSPPWLVEAESAEGSPENLRLIKPVLHAGEPSRSTPALRASSGSLVDGNRVFLDNPSIGIGGGSVVPLPDAVGRRLERPDFRMQMRFGRSGNLGVFLRPELTIPWTDNLDFVGGIEGFTSRGALVAPGADYRGQTSTGTYEGSLRSGWIHDFGSSKRLGVDILGRDIDRGRGLVEWRHLQDLSNGAYLAANLNWWSDSEVTRDFRPELFGNQPMPDSWAEYGRPVGRHGLFSVFVRMRADDFQPVTQRVPEIRFDLTPSALGETGIVQKGFVSGSYLRRTLNDPTALATFNDTLRAEALRFDAYYGLERPVQLADWATFTPLAGVRYTAEQSVGADRKKLGLPDRSQDRAIAVVGADLRLLAHGAFDTNFPVWDIHGIRHLIEPVVQYRSFLGSGGTPFRDPVSALESYRQGLFEGELELDRMRDTDAVGNANVVRTGLRNTFVTRGADGGSRELLYVYAGQEYRSNDRASADLWQALFTEVRFTPASFLEAGWNARYSHDRGQFTMSNPYIRVRNGRLWSFTVASHYLSGRYDEYSLGGELYLNEVWSTAFRFSYDAQADRWREQAIVLRQILDNRWRIDYSLSRRFGDLRNDEITVGVSAALLRF